MLLKLLKVLEDLLSIPFLRCASPSEREQSLPQTRQQEQSVGQREAGRRDASCALTPMMRALIELEETRATESRAPCKNSSDTHSMTHAHSQDMAEQAAVYLPYSDFLLNVVRSHNSSIFLLLFVDLRLIKHHNYQHFCAPVRTHSHSVLVLSGLTLRRLDNSSLQGSAIRGPKLALWSRDTKSPFRSRLGFRRSTEKRSHREELRLELSKERKVEWEQPPLA